LGEVLGMKILWAKVGAPESRSVFQEIRMERGMGFSHFTWVIASC
jgi:hypothetical protein